MSIFRSFGGMIEFEVVCADPSAALDAIAGAGIILYRVAAEEDGVTLRITVMRRDAKKLALLMDKKGCSLKSIGSAGVYWTIRTLRRRPVLLCGLAILFALALYLPSRVFFVQVEGNESVPTRLILEKCNDCGISFGASRRQVRSEKMKNALLAAIPELQWAGVNTSGCVATVTVKERSDAEAEEKKVGVSSIVAARDGIVSELTVTQGNVLCRVGQAVRAGDLLVSGYTDCGICIRATRSEGEIYGLTQRLLTAVIPSQWVSESENQPTEKKFALIIGKKRINFYKGSGISGGSCDKIYSENYITLPGGFQLPVAIVTEVWSDGGKTPTNYSNADGVLTDFADDYLFSQMVAGSILERDCAVTEEDGYYCLRGSFACSEIIGQVRDEEIIKPNGNDN